MQTKLIPAAIAAALLLASGCGQSADSRISALEKQPTTPGANAAETSKPNPATLEQVRSQTLVTVNGKPVTGEMFGIYINDRVQTSPGAKNTPGFQNQVINELVNIILLAQAATSAGLDKRPNVATALELQRTQLLSRVALQEYAAKTQPTGDDLKKAYDKRYANQEGEEYKARHILVKTEGEAKKLIEELNGGADFAELAKEHSTGPTGKNGGDLGWFDAAQMVKPFADAVKGLKQGTVSPTPVETQFGWHVIQLEDKRAKQPPTLESVQGKLRSDIQRQNLADYVNQLRAKATVDINEEFTQKSKAGTLPAPTGDQ